LAWRNLAAQSLTGLNACRHRRIEQGDVLTAINGSSPMRASDFAETISMTARGTLVYLSTSRNGKAMRVALILSSTPCRAGG
jgi:PDZ domain-containing secreted protein